MGKDVVEEIVKERITNNLKIFNEKELQFMKKNANIIVKVYLIGMLDNN